jgi:hypothetical protein
MKGRDADLKRMYNLGNTDVDNKIILKLALKKVGCEDVV